MGLFDKKKEPIILKETSSAQEQIDALNKLLLTAPAEKKAKIEQDIKMLSYGIFGEAQILFELKNSHMPMYVLHDLYLEDNGLTAQIDFLIITERVSFIVECKNLIGNIEINAHGDFIRTINYGKKFVQEGIYSPITQNQRHMALLKALWTRSGSNFVIKAMREKYFPTSFKGIVVLANPKTVLNDRYAKKDVKEQVIRADQLVSYMRDVNTRTKDSAMDDKTMENRAQFFLSAHQENTMDYAAKYKTTESPVAVTTVQETPTTYGVLKSPKMESIRLTDQKPPLCPKCGSPMILRTATKGNRAGKKFWGCSNYPKCRSIINLD